MRTFIRWTPALVVLTVILVGCNPAGPEDPMPSSKTRFNVTVSEPALYCNEGDTVAVFAKVSSDKLSSDSVPQSVAFITKNAAVATASSITTDTATRALVSCRKQGTGDIDTRWTNGDTVITKTIVVNVAPSLMRTFVLMVRFAHVGEVAEGMEAKIWWPQAPDTLRTTVNAQGRVVVTVPRTQARTVSFRLSGDTRYHAAEYAYTYATDAMDTGRMTIIPVPTRYVIPMGAGAGDTVPVSVDGLYRLSGDGVLRWLNTNSFKQVLAEGFPRTVCFDPQNSNITLLTSADSAQIRAAISDIRDSLGREMYRFGDGSACRVRLRIDTTRTASGGTSGLVILRHRPSYLSLFTLIHELGHDLSLGHTCSFTSTMLTGCPALGSDGFSRMDNAMWHLSAELLSLELLLGEDVVSYDAAYRAITGSQNPLAKVSSLPEVEKISSCEGLE